jgi:hypothetical protein
MLRCGLAGMAAVAGDLLPATVVSADGETSTEDYNRGISMTGRIPEDLGEILTIQRHDIPRKGQIT